MGIFNKIRDFVFPEIEEKVDYKVIADSEKEKQLVEDKTVKVKKISEVEDAAKNPLDIPIKSLQKQEIGKQETSSKRKHIDISDVTTIKKTNEKTVVNKPTTAKVKPANPKVYQPKKIISPIFGQNEVKDDLIQEQVINKTAPVVRKPNNHQNSALDTIISPIYGTHIKSSVTVNKKEPTPLKSEAEKKVETPAQKTQPQGTKTIQSIDDILEIPDKVVLNNNMTIFDEDIKEQK